MNKEIDKFLVLSGFANTVLFVFILFLVASFYPGYSHLRDSISELGAIDSPVKDMANFFIFLPTGMLVVFFAVGLRRSIGVDWSAKLGSILLVISGIILMLVAFFPCDPQCRNYTFQYGIAHEFLSNTSLYVAAMALSLFALHAKTGLSFRPYWFYLFIGVTLLSSALAYSYPQIGRGEFNGLIQRIALFLPFSLMTVASLTLYKLKFARSRE